MITYDHLVAFLKDAGIPDKQRLERSGACNGVEWAIGLFVADAGQSTCPDCFREIGGGMTVYRPAGSGYHRLKSDVLYVCAACFPWDRAVTTGYGCSIPDNQRPKRNLTPSPKVAAKKLAKITRERCPRFRVKTPEVMTADKDRVVLALAVIEAETRLRHLKVA